MRSFHKLLLLTWISATGIWLVVRFGRNGLTIDSRGWLAYSNPRGETKEQEPVATSPAQPSESPEVPQQDVVHSSSQPRPLPQTIPGSDPGFNKVPIAVHLPPDDGSHITEIEIQQYVDNIWDLENSLFYRTECDTQNNFPPRYEKLRQLAIDHKSSKVKYFFALDLFEVRSLLPRLMGTIVQVVKMLGPEKCAISIVEGRSQDGTYAVLLALEEKLTEIGTRYWLTQSDLNPRGEGVDRIGALSELRNLALKPLTHPKQSNSTGLFSADTLTLFLNDIAVCTDDIYEMLFQHNHQSAHQTCAMDWTFGGGLFYDSWVSRSMSGDLFFEVPQDSSFAFSDNMFWDHQPTKEKWERHQPFQVYSCWGGMIVINSAPFINGKIEFRNSSATECYCSEPHNLAKDLWRLGYGKIQTVPTVNVGYNSHDGRRIKKRRGYVGDYVDTNVPVEEEKDEYEYPEGETKFKRKTELIQWVKKPPGQVKCLPRWGVISWTEP